MTDLVKSAVRSSAGRALDVALFGVGLAEGIARGVYGRMRALRGVDSAIPEQRQQPVPRVPRRPTPDPYDVDVMTPVGTTGAGPGYNPDTAEADLQQPGTEPLMDPATTKAVKAETDHLRKAAERNPEG